MNSERYAGSVFTKSENHFVWGSVRENVSGTEVHNAVQITVELIVVSKIETNQGHPWTVS